MSKKKTKKPAKSQMRRLETQVQEALRKEREARQKQQGAEHGSETSDNRGGSGVR